MPNEYLSDNVVAWALLHRASHSNVVERWVVMYLLTDEEDWQEYATIANEDIARAVVRGQRADNKRAVQS